MADLDDLGLSLFDFVDEDSIVQARVVGFNGVLLPFSRFGTFQRGELDVAGWRRMPTRTRSLPR